MPTEGTPQNLSKQRYLAPMNPGPSKFSIRRPIANAVDLRPRQSAVSQAALGTMGLDPVARICHLAWDIGAGALTEMLAESLGATAVLAEYSRLVVDCNRNLMDPSAFWSLATALSFPPIVNSISGTKDARASEIYWPYHYAVDVEIKRLSAIDYPPAMFAIHSFTPVMNGTSRPWEIGILWDTDRPTAEILIEGFREAGYFVGDNEPYSGKAPMDFTIDHHAEAVNLPHVGIEIRQDLISNQAGVEAVARVLHDIIKSVPSGGSRDSTDRVEHSHTLRRADGAGGHDDRKST